jgi:hypothetical protein
MTIRRGFAVALSAVALAAFGASTAEAAITIPTGDGAVLSGASSQSCNDLEYGYVLANATPVAVARHAGGCNTDPLAGTVIPAAASDRSLLIYLTDNTCGGVYYSDGSGNGNHVLVAGNNPYTVYLNDAGGGCPFLNSTWTPMPTFASFTVTVTLTRPQPPPTVTVTPPSAPVGQSGFFNNHDLSAAGGSIPVRVSAQDNSTTGIASITCTDNGRATVVSNASPVGAPIGTGTVQVIGNGKHTIVCSATDRLGDTGNTGGANSGTISVDSTDPVVSVPAGPVIVTGGTSGASVSSYTISAADADVGDSPTLRCTPAAPATFPVGDTTVSCQATDRAANVGAGRFVVRVLAPTTVSVLSVSRAGAADTVTLNCLGSVGQGCAGTLAATVTVGSRRGSLASGRISGTTLTVATATVSISAGQSANTRLILNRAGRQRLTHSYRLRAALSFGTQSLGSLLFAYRLVTPPPDASWASWTWLNQPCSFCYTTIDPSSFFGVPKLLLAAKVNVRCLGASCPRPRTFGPGRRSVDLRRLLRGRKFGPGTVIDLQITAPNSVGRLVSYTTRAGSVPARTVRCLPPGARRPSPCATGA